MEEKKMQLYFYDDDTFEFRKLPLQYGCLLEKKGDKLIRAWRHSYAGQYSFGGYKNITAGTVTLGFARDIFLDPHNKIPFTDDTTGKPKDVKAWIGKVGETMRHTYRASPTIRTLHDWINFALIGVIVIMAISWGIRYAGGG